VTALGTVLGHETRTVAELAAVLGSIEDVTVVMVDDVDTWRLAASWLRADLLPALPASTRFVLAGAGAPPPAWSTEYGRYFFDIKLGALLRTESDAAVAAAGLSAETAERIWQLSCGHPLALRMAIHAAHAPEWQWVYYLRLAEGAVVFAEACGLCLEGVRWKRAGSSIGAGKATGGWSVYRTVLVAWSTPPTGWRC
jgi:hypothetical protein